MVQEIIFRFTPSVMGSYDQPKPDIPPNAGVILLQRGHALVGIWDAEICGFAHPANQVALAAEALAAVLGSYADADLASDEIRFFTCPQSLIERFDWDWSRKPKP